MTERRHLLRISDFLTCLIGQQVQERLSFLRFLLKDGQLWLCAPQAKQIWNCLAESAVFPHDREACFKWFSKLMGEEPDLDPEINREFFENNILQLEPCLMTESGIRYIRLYSARVLVLVLIVGLLTL